MQEIQKLINFAVNSLKLGKPDYRAINANQVTPINPVPFTNLDPNMIGGVQMQNFQPSCTEFLIVYLMKLYYFLLLGKVINFNMAFLRKIYNKTYNVTASAGTDPILMLKLIMQFGCATFATVPDLSTESTEAFEDFTTLTEEAYAEALQYKIPGFVQIDLTPEAFAAAIKQYGLIGVCMNVNARWYQDATGKVSWSPQDISPRAK